MFVLVLKHSPLLPHLEVFFQLYQFAPALSWACFVASQCLDWHKEVGGRYWDQELVVLLDSHELGRVLLP